jgi:site-specific DNA recombinase
MFAEYEKAQLMERYRRGKAWRAKTGSVNVLGGAPFGYRYVRKTPESGARYEVIPHEAVLVAEMFRRYADDGAAIADLGRWLTAEGVATRTGKERWDRSVIWGMLRNPAYAGTAVFGKTQVVHEPAGLNRTARLAGRTVPRQVRTQGRPREEWTGIPVPALVDEETFDRVQQRLADNKRFASRNTKVPSLLQGIAACASCGYGYYRTTTTTTAGNKIYYYRCLGSDDYRYQGGRVCQNRPVRADYADQVVWDHVTALLADPALIRAEIGKRLERARTSDPVTRKRGQLEQALAKTSTSINAMITAFSEQLITIDELRARMPGLRARETGLKRPDRRPRRPGRRPRRLPQARRRPRRLPHPPPRERGHRNRRGPAARPARRRPGRPRRPREDNHPPPHPGPGTSQRRRPPRHHRHGG